MTALFCLDDPNEMGETQFLAVPLESNQADVLNDFIADHWGELREKLIAAGMPVDGSILQPTWTRLATTSDLRILGSIEDQRDAAADLVAQVSRRAQAAIKAPAFTVGDFRRAVREGNGAV